MRASTKDLIQPNSTLKRKRTSIQGKLKYGVCVCVCVCVDKLIKLSRRILDILYF